MGMAHGDSFADEITVIRGADEGLVWSVTAMPRPDGAIDTFITRHRGSARARSGFRSRPFDRSAPMVSTWSGIANGLPQFVVVHTQPEVSRMVIVGTSTRAYLIPLTEVVPQLGLRFGAVALAPGDFAASIESVPNSSSGTLRAPEHPRIIRGLAGWRPAGNGGGGNDV